MFAAYVSGRSMEPLIPDGAFASSVVIPQAHVQGRIVLVQDCASWILIQVAPLRSSATEE